MNVLGRYLILPKAPQAIKRLEELAYNLWWSWEPDAQALFERIDPALWESINHNPVRLLQMVSQERLDAAAADPVFMQDYQSVMAAFDRYMDAGTPTWYGSKHGSRRDRVIAYFSAEFGLHEALPIYSGGLGILSGDHCKTASDLGLPFIGVGFLYPQGYFTQRIDAEGRQQAEYEKINLDEVPARPALDRNGSELLISVDLPGRTVYAKIWRIQVGRIPIYLLDTDVPRNAPQDRELSARLYGGDREMRISQEIVLGIGGVRAVAALGYEPAVWHMNEGHSAFLGLERARQLIQEHGLTFDEAVEAVRANTVFTTHTPVPAGNDAFAFELVDKFFWQYWGQLGLDRERFVEFARQELPWGPQYSMTVLAIRLSGYCNGVSALHGQVSREMWQFLWPDTPVAEVPIGHITNGVHVKTWVVKELQDVYSLYMGSGWHETPHEPQVWAAVDRIPDEELWSLHHLRKTALINLVRTRLRRQALRHGEGPIKVNAAARMLDPKALTIGFARRFATYKRATLLFRDIERIKRILNDPERPVQIIFSGKAHPDDEPGKEFIQRIYELSQEPGFAGKVVFVENYDMNLARHLVSGVDLWLNTPRRPREASGTSGQKAAMSGIPNFSVLDGWWVEGFDGTNGWSIGEERDYKNADTQDDADSIDLYTTLEQSIIPLYYRRSPSGVPVEWVRLMKNSIRTCAPVFNTHRMVIDYTTNYYLPAGESSVRFSADSYALARSLARWKGQMRHKWNGIHIEAARPTPSSLLVGTSLPVEARLSIQGIEPENVAVEGVVLPQDSGEQRAPETFPLERIGEENGSLLYRGVYTPQRSGPILLGVRVLPRHDGMIHPLELGLVHWA